MPACKEMGKIRSKAPLILFELLQQDDFTLYCLAGSGSKLKATPKNSNIQSYIACKGRKMNKKSSLSFFAIFLVFHVFAQVNTGEKKNALSIFERIAKSVKDYKIDTTNAPDDKITRKIIELRRLRGGFNINEVVDFKLEEDRQKKEIPVEELDRLSQFFKTGNGKKWLDNSAIWIYRQHFSYKDLRQLVRFYKTSAGQKMADDFPIVMMQSLAAAEMIKGILMPTVKN